MAGVVWKVGTRRAIAYVEGRAAAERVLALTGRGAATAPDDAAAAAGGPPNRAKNRRAERDRAREQEKDGGLPGAMAVYTDRRGRPFAWQIPFDVGHFETVARVVEEEKR